MAEKKYLVDLNLNKNELKQAVIENQGLAPTSPKDGQIYYSTESNAKGVKVYKTGTTSAWKKLLDEDDANNYVPTSRTINTKALSSDVNLYGTDIPIDNTSGASNVKDYIDNLDITINGAASTIKDDDLTVNRAVISNSSGKIAVSDTTSTELGYVHGVTSAIQTQLNNKEATITGAATTITANDLTASKVLVSDANGKVATSSVTATEIGYLSGTTSNIQDQIDNLEARGRFLSVWNSTTGLPETNPGALPFTYKTGDYYIVGTVGSTNYKPTGSTYTGTASSTTETQTVAANDVYYYDGTNWILQVNSQREVTFASITGQPTDNTNLATALGNKADLVSPTFTGTPIAPTAANGTNTTQIATTAFVQNAIASASLTLAVNNPALTASGGLCTWTITNTLNNADVICSLREVSTGEEVYVNMTYTASTITIKINSSSDISAGTYRAVVIGQAIAAS